MSTLRSQLHECRGKVLTREVEVTQHCVAVDMAATELHLDRIGGTFDEPQGLHVEGAPSYYA